MTNIYPISWTDTMVPPTQFTTGGTALAWDEMADMNPTTGQGNISSIVIASIERLNMGYVATNLFLLGFDIHFEADTIGSFGVVTK